MNFTVILRFLLIHVLLTAALGGIFGWVVGRLFLRFRLAAQVAVQLSLYGQWIPVLLLWALPVWPPQESYWSTATYFITLCIVIAIALSTISRYLILQLMGGIESRELYRELARDVTLKSFFFGMIAQVWVSPYGWNWFSAVVPNGSTTVIGVVAIMVFLAGAINAAFRTNFFLLVIYSRKIGENYNRIVSPVGNGVALVLAGLCILIWYVAREFIYESVTLVPPNEVLLELARITTSSTTGVLNIAGSFWYHFGVSLLRTVFGMIVGIGLALFAARLRSIERVNENRAVRLLPFILVSSLPLAQISTVFFGLEENIRTILGIALLSFYPSIEVIWSFSKPYCFSALLVAAHEALPYSLIGMVFGESIYATAGLGFLMIMSRANEATLATGAAVASLLLIIFLLASAALRISHLRRLRRKGVTH